jgi:nicotinamidase-related amidase
MNVSFDAALEPHFHRSALITIDAQRDTLDGQPAEIPGTSAALPAIAELVRTFRRFHRPIVHMVRLYLRDGSNVDICRRSVVAAGASWFIAGSAGAELADGLAPSSTELDVDLLLAGRPQEIGDREVVMHKPRWGAFFDTCLGEHLGAQGADTLVFSGANFPNCPRTSIYEASERDYRIVVARDAISRLDSAGIEQLEGIGVRIRSVPDIARSLQAAGASGERAQRAVAASAAASS